MNRTVLFAGLAVVAPLVAVLVVGLGRDPNTKVSPLIGRPAPPFVLRPVGGGEVVSLDSLRGRPVILNFWATWCVPCVEEHDVLVNGARAWGAEVQFLGVIYEDEEDAVARHLRKHGSAYPSVFDDAGKAAIAYGVYGVPETFFISPDGTIVEKFVGPLTAETLSANLRKAMGK